MNENLPYNFRITHGEDIIPHLNKSSSGYQHAGT